MDLTLDSQSSRVSLSERATCKEDSGDGYTDASTRFTVPHPGQRGLSGTQICQLLPLARTLPWCPSTFRIKLELLGSQTGLPCLCLQAPGNRVRLSLLPGMFCTGSSTWNALQATNHLLNSYSSDKTRLTSSVKFHPRVGCPPPVPPRLPLRCLLPSP